MDDTISILNQLLEWRLKGHQTAMATVIKTWGSAPRRTGSTMAINDQMAFQGSVSGGCVETAVIEQALAAIRTKDSQLLEFGVSHEQAWEVGLACGGRIEILVQYITDQKADQISTLIDLAARDESAVLLVGLDSDSVFEVVKHDQLSGYSFFDSTENAVLQKSLVQDKAYVIEKDQARYFSQPFNPEVRLYITGAVHITQQLARVIEPLGLKVIVVDPRAAFATPERFPNVELIRRWPVQAFAELNLNHRTAVIALTHDPKFDDPALKAGLDSDAFYIGALGSRKTHASRIQRLLDEGYDKQQLNRIHAPIGLDINASNPAEIAISIVAELVQQLRKND